MSQLTHADRYYRAAAEAGGGRAQGTAEAVGAERGARPAPPPAPDAPPPGDVPRAAAPAAEGGGKGETTTTRRRRRRNTSFDGIVPDAATLHETAWAKVPTGRCCHSAAARAACEELVRADAARSESRERVERAREALDDALAHLAWEEAREAEAEERFQVARAEAEEADLRGESAGRVGKWNERFARLEAFKAVHGHCRVRLVPGWKADPKLVELERFVSRAKDAYRSYEKGVATTLRPHRIVALERLGVFVGKWEERFRELVAFKEEHGHCNAPTKSRANPKLGNWVGFQRAEYRKHKEGKYARITEERIQRLEEVGFCFNLYEARGIKREPYNNNRRKKLAAEENNEDEPETEEKHVEDSGRGEENEEDSGMNEEPEEDSESELCLG